MKYLKTVGLCLVAVVALSAVTVASASAAELELVKAGGGTIVKKGFSGKTGKGTLETVGGNKITCKETEFKGEVKTTKEAEATVTFTGCEAFGFKCNSSKAKSGEIVTKLSIVPVFDLLSGGVDHPALLLTILPLGSGTVALECASGLQKLTVRGGAIALISGKGSSVGEPTKEIKVQAKQKKGVQEAKEYMISTTEAGKSIHFETEGSGVKTFKFEESGEETEEIPVKFEEEVELREN